MLAPKAPGQRVRELYLQNFGTPALVAVETDYSGKAWDRILGMAKATGCSRAGILETTFREEVETDWFGEQVDLCGGVENMVKNSFETLVEAGYSPEGAYFECLHELKLIVDLVQRYGIAGMYRRVSETARYGGLTRGKVAIDQNVKKNMKKVLKQIQDGTFAKEWVGAYEKEGPQAFDKYMKELRRSPDREGWQEAPRDNVARRRDNLRVRTLHPRPSLLLSQSPDFSPELLTGRRSRVPTTIWTTNRPPGSC